jgi:SAM-dependent methyltransferase
MRMSIKGESSFAGSDTSDDVENLDLYEATAKYYDIWNEDYQEDVQFYLKLAARTGGPVLECMSGTGRILIPFAREGHEITGVDRSPAMLDMCSTKIAFEKANVEARIEIVMGDIRDFKVDRKFKLAFVPFNSFLHLLETKDQEAALLNIRDHLVDGGLFSFAVFAPRLDRPEQLLRHRGTKLTHQGEIISWFEAQTFDQPNQRTTVTYFYDISRQDRPVRRITTVFTLRYLFCREATELLARCGFEVESVSGDYGGGELKSNSDLMVFVARKKR